MERKIWIGFIAVIGMVLSTVSAPVYGAQLAINSNDPMLYGRPIVNQWTGEIMGSYFGFDQSSEIITWETKKMGMEIVPNFKHRFQWSDISHNIVDYPSDTAIRKVFQPYGTVWTHNWATEEIFSNYSFFSSKETHTEEKDDTSGLPPLPNALWICGFGIIGILSVRRTSDHSNVT